MFVLHTSLAKINKQFILLIKNINTYSVLLKVLQYKFECSKYLLQYDMFVFHTSNCNKENNCNTLRIVP